MMFGGLLVASAIAVAVTALLFGRRRERPNVDRVMFALSQSAAPVPDARSVHLHDLADLPAPVERYFRYVLTDGQAFVRAARMRQSGELRTGTKAKNWLAFTAQHLASPAANGFAWHARVNGPLGTHLTVLDSYLAGIASERVSLLAAVVISSASGVPELNAGALHRYLAEAVWYPTALLPRSGIKWSAIDERSARATVTDSGMTVSLEFRFNEDGAVAGVYTPERIGRFGGGYRQKAWEGHFRDYQLRQGMRVPVYGEVGWYEGDQLELVRKGTVTDVQYEFGWPPNRGAESAKDNHHA